MGDSHKRSFGESVSGNRSLICLHHDRNDLLMQEHVHDAEQVLTNYLFRAGLHKGHRYPSRYSVQKMGAGKHRMHSDRHTCMPLVHACNDRTFRCTSRMHACLHPCMHACVHMHVCTYMMYT